MLRWVLALSAMVFMALGPGCRTQTRGVAPQNGVPPATGEQTSQPVEKAPEGRWGCIVTHRTDGLLWVSVEGTATRKVIDSTPPEAPGSPAAVSPDGRKVAFFSGSGELKVHDLLSDKVVVLSVVSEDNRHFVGSLPWAPDSSRLAFINEGNVYVGDLQGNSKLLTNTADAGSLAWSPDGKQVAFARRDKQDNDVGLFAVDAAGGEPTQLAPPNAEEPVFAAHAPVWSPDGTTIAYLQSYEGASLCFVRPGADPHRNVDLAAVPLRWLGDSSAVVYNAMSPESGSEGLRRCVPGGEPETLLDGSVICFDILPSGEIAVGVDVEAQDPMELSGSFNVGVLKPDGTARHGEWTVTRRGSAGDCLWRPDGQMLAAFSLPADEDSGTLAFIVPGEEYQVSADQEVSGITGLLGWARAK